MKVGLLAGGLGTRLGEETETRPKPLVDIGGRPILWHIMKLFSHYGHSEFVVALGYKGEQIKQYYLDYRTTTGSLSIQLGKPEQHWHEPVEEDWKIDLIETGDATMTGGRIKRMLPHLGPGTFMLTYGDGVSDIDLNALLEFHKSHGKIATVTAVRPPARFGQLEIDGNRVTSFMEKPQVTEGWINGGFFVLEPEVTEYIDGDQTSFEQQPLQRLADAGELMAFQHDGFWRPMDTLRDVRELRTMWESGAAPWKTWS